MPLLDRAKPRWLCCTPARLPLGAASGEHGVPGAPGRLRQPQHSSEVSVISIQRAGAHQFLFPSLAIA